MYSEMYYQQIKDLQEWYELQLKSFPVLNISEADYKKGIDALPEAYRQLNLTAFNKWLNEKNYELSYSQSCSALFAAMNHLGLIEDDAIDFRNGAKYIPDQVTTARQSGERVIFYPSEHKWKMPDGSFIS